MCTNMWWIMYKCEPDMKHTSGRKVIAQSSVTEPLIFLHSQSGSNIFSSSNDVIHKCS